MGGDDSLHRPSHNDTPDMTFSYSIISYNNYCYNQTLVEIVLLQNKETRLNCV